MQNIFVLCSVPIGINFFISEADYSKVEDALKIDAVIRKPSDVFIASPVTFNIIPLVLLAVYPSRYFQRVLNHFQFRNHTLIIFMDTFQGNFKIQPYDCRYFAAFYLVLRMVNLSVLIWTRSGLYFYLSGYIFIFATLVVAAFRPYPKMRHTMVDIVLLSSVSLASFWYSVFFTASILDPSHCAGKKSLIVSGLLVSLPAIYAVLFHLHKMLPRLLMIKLKALINRSRDDCHRERNYQYNTSDEHIPILPNSPTLSLS